MILGNAPACAAWSYIEFDKVLILLNWISGYSDRYDWTVSEAVTAEMSEIVPTPLEDVMESFHMG
jgi:hypothetical protein